MYGGDLPASIGPLDWYAFDVAAAVRYADRIEQNRNDPEEDRPVQDRVPMAASAAVRDDGNTLAIRGTEIPPWEQ